MEMTLLKKYRLKSGNTLAAINLPEQHPGFPPDIALANSLEGEVNQVHLFVKTKAELDNIAPAAMGALMPDGLLWVHYPKGSSGIQSDLTRDKGWEVFKGTTLQFVNLISVDDTWSAFGLAKRATPAKKVVRKPAAATTPAVNRFIDKVKRIVKAPPDLQKALAKKAKAKALFDQLPFTHKKEYVEWILGAKQEETRRRRVAQTVTRLAGGLKNPYAKK